jgi:hypothetical protein
VSGVAVDRRKHEKKLSEALSEDKERISARKGLIDKTATLVKVSDDGVEADAGSGATMRPTDEQLAKINGFTRKTVTADEVVAFTTLSCNDIPDRDDDQFSKQCVKDFAELPQPYSPTGKSFMLDHEYKVGNAVGRIFETDTTTKSGATFLTNGVYMPKTAQFEPLIEKIDFGINWAVSVGVMLGKDECSLSFCKAPFSSWGWWCQNGHDKGLYYTEDAEEDSWGYPKPCDPKTSKAEKCIRVFSDPRDMYELSQVFLGAQYFAALDKDPAFASVMKSVASKELPIIGVSKKEAENLPIPHEPRKLAEARRKGLVKEADDGALVWTDSEGLRWTFDPENPSDGVLSLGKATNDSEEEEDGEHEVPGGSGSDPNGASDGDVAPVANAGAGDGGSGSSSDPADPSGVEPSGVEGSSVDDEEDSEEDEDSDDTDDDSSEDEDDEDSEEEKSVNKEDVLRAARKSNLSEAAIKAIEESKGTGLDALLLAVSSDLKTAEEKVSELTPKAALGDQYVRELRAEAIDAYVMNHATKDQPKVDVSTYEKLLDRVGEDPELLKAMRDEQQAEAQKKFPKAVRRSSFPSDPNTVEPITQRLGDVHEEVSEGGDDNDRRVKRIHG